MGSSFISAVGTVLFMVGFAIGMGSTLGLYTTEIIPPIGVGVTVGLQWFGAALIGKFVPILALKLGASTLVIIFIIINVLIAGYVYIFARETANLSEKEIEDSFNKNK